MSGNVPCTCREPARRDHWRVSQYRCNHSAFNGYHETPSDYSTVVCERCRGFWRTKARYVEALQPEGEAK